MDIITTLINASFFFNDTATTGIYSLSLHDALPISRYERLEEALADCVHVVGCTARPRSAKRNLQRPREAAAELFACSRSEEHTSELQSRGHLVCRLLLEKKNTYDDTGNG